MHLNIRVSRSLVAIFAAVLTTSLVAGAAFADEQTRESYVAQVEPICKKNQENTSRFLKGVEKEVKQGQLKKASRQVAQANAAGKKSIAQIKAVPKPAADTAKLNKWVGFLEKEQKLLGEISSALKAENKSQVQRLRVLLTHNGNQANTAALGFEFHYCLIETSKLG